MDLEGRQECVGRGWTQRRHLGSIAPAVRDATRPYVDIHRIRRQRAAAVFVDAARLVERRSRAGPIRIGVADLEILPLQ